MKAVPPHALGLQLSRPATRRLEPFDGCAWKGRVEAADLDDMRRPSCSGANAGQIVRLVQGGQRDETLEPGQDRSVEQDGSDIGGTAMHDAVPDRLAAMVAEMRAYEVDETPHGAIMGAGLPVPPLFGDYLPPTSWAEKCALVVSSPSIFPLRKADGSVAIVHVNGELDAG